MNQDHLTPEVRKKVIEANEAYLKLQKEQRDKGIGILWSSEKEGREWFSTFHNPVSNVLNFDEFTELFLLELRNGFISGYMVGSNLNSKGSTTIKIG